MAGFWFWFFLALISLVIGFILTVIFYGLYCLIYDFIKKYRMPKDKTGMTLWINKNSKELLFDISKDDDVNRKEEVKNGIQRQQKYREFEKLRRFDINTGSGKGSNKAPEWDGSSDKGAESIQRRELLQDGVSPVTGKPESGNDQSKRKVKLDD